MPAFCEPSKSGREDERLVQLHRRKWRGGRIRARAIGSLLAGELGPRRERQMQQRAELERAVLGCVDPQMRGLVQVQDVCGGVLRIAVLPPLGAEGVRWQWQERIREAVRQTRAGRGVRRIVFHAKVEP